MPIMIIAILSLKSELLSQYRMPNTLNIDVMSSNDTLDSVLIHCVAILAILAPPSYHMR